MFSLLHPAVLKADSIDGKESVTKMKLAVDVVPLNIINIHSTTVQLESDSKISKICFEGSCVEDLSFFCRDGIHDWKRFTAGGYGSYSHPHWSSAWDLLGAG